MQLILGGIILLLLFIYITNKYKSADPKDILYSMRWAFVGGVLLLILFLVVTGKVQMIWLAVLSFLPWVRRFLMAKNIYKKFNAKSQNNYDDQNDKNYPNNKTDAYDVLGLKRGASKNEICDAHRKLMKKHHPDAGGDVERAAIINRAKDILLG